jgi:N-methylhydantoinase A
MLVTNITREFHKAHEANYGFASTSEPIQVVNVAIKAIGDLDVPTLPKAIISDEVKPKYFRSTLFELGNRHNTPVYKRSDLVAEQSIKGPAIVEQMDTTILIFPNDVGLVDAWGNLIISLSE